MSTVLGHVLCGGGRWRLAALLLSMGGGLAAAPAGGQTVLSAAAGGGAAGAGATISSPVRERVCLSLRELSRLVEGSGRGGGSGALPEEAQNLASMDPQGYIIADDQEGGDIILIGEPVRPAPLSLSELADLLGSARARGAADEPFVSLDPEPAARERFEAACRRSLDPTDEASVTRFQAALAEAIGPQVVRSSLRPGRLRSVLVREDYFMKAVSQRGDPVLQLAAVCGPTPGRAGGATGSIRQSRFWFHVAGPPVFEVERDPLARAVVLTRLAIGVSAESQIGDPRAMRNVGGVGGADPDAERFAASYSGAIASGGMSARGEWREFAAAFRLYALLRCMQHRGEWARARVDPGPIARFDGLRGGDAAATVPGLANVMVSTRRFSGGLEFGVAMVAGGVTLACDIEGARYDLVPQLDEMRRSVLASRPSAGALWWVVQVKQAARDHPGDSAGRFAAERLGRASISVRKRDVAGGGPTCPCCDDPESAVHRTGWPTTRRAICEEL